MSVRIISATAVLVAVGFANGQSLKLPTEVRGSPGSFVVVRAETDGAKVKWYSLSAGLNVFPAELLADKKATVVTANAPGRYRLMAWTAIGGEPSDAEIVQVVIGDVPPPGPGPVPPPGPGPVPPPPGPIDPLTKRIYDALLADTDSPTDKRKHAAALAGFYAAMAAHVGDKSIATIGDFLSDYRKAIPSIIPAGAISGTRKVCGAEVSNLAGEDPDKAIDDSMRAAFVDLFKKIAASLESFKSMGR